MGLVQTPTERRRLFIGRGLFRLFLVLWVGWVFYWTVVWPVQITMHDRIPVTAVYADAFRSLGETAALATVVLIALPLAALGIGTLLLWAARWVVRGFRAESDGA